MDSVLSRLEIADTLCKIPANAFQRDSPLYWMDFGNTRDTGQVFLCSLTNIKQADSSAFETVPALPDFIGLFEQSQSDQPSCSPAQALGKQGLFINSTIANFGASLLWSMFRQGILKYRGFYANLKDFKAQPIKVG